MEEGTLTFFVNGVKRAIAGGSISSSEKTLLSYLRDDLGLKGTKYACGEGGCGACTVTLSRWYHVEKKVVHSAVNACMVRLCSLHGTSVTTVEGLGSVKRGLHPVQERIYKAHGSQCGYCTPGMVMSMSSALREKDKFRVEDVERALQGNLCRCTGYRPIVEAFRTFCQDEENGQANPTATLSGVEAVPTFDKGSFKPYDPQRDDPETPSEIGLGEKKSLALTPKKGPKWFKPKDYLELLDLRSKYEKVEFFGGGTGKYKLPQDSSPGPDVIVQVTDLPDLCQVVQEADGVFFGSSLTVSNLQHYCSKLGSTNQTFQVLSQVLASWVSPQVRNCATIGGHVCWAHPCSDIMPILMALGSSLRVQTKAFCQTKIIDLDETFFTEAFKTKVENGDLILGIKIPFAKQNQRLFFYRRARRKEFDLAVANTAILATADEAGKVQKALIYCGGMEAPYPGARAHPATRLTKTAAYLEGKSAQSFNRTELARVVNSEVPTDERSPGKYSDYRRCLVACFLERFLNDAAAGSFQVDQRPAMVGHQLFEKILEGGIDHHDRVHRPVPHVSAAEQACGEANYVDDVPSRADELHCVPVQSERPTAIVKAIDFSRALEVPGVVGFVAPEDVPFNYFGVIKPDEEVLAREPKYRGQFVAALVCQNVEAGREARRLVKVVYEDREAVFDIREAKNDLERNLLKSPVVRRRNRFEEEGTTNEVLAEGDTVEVEGTVYIGGQEHFYMEPHCAVATPSGEGDDVTVWASSQDLRSLQHQIARVLKLPLNKVVVKTKRLGGGFGGKERVLQSAVVASVAARKFDRPVRMALTREEDMATTGRRHNVEISYKVTASSRTGKLGKVSYIGQIDSGCSSDLTPGWVNALVGRMDGAYSMPDFAMTANLLRTNTATTVAMRAFGGPQGQYLAEIIMEHIAHKSGLDPKAVREANLTRDGDMLHEHETVKGCTLLESWEEMLKSSHYEERRKEVEEFNAMNRVSKRGLALVPLKFHISMKYPGEMQGYAFLRLYTDGTAVLSHGGVEMGQGIATKMRQVCSKALGIPMDMVALTETSTDVTTNITATAASLGTDLNGPAVMDACAQIRARLDPLRKEMGADVAWADLVEEAYERQIPLSAFGHYAHVGIDFDAETMRGDGGGYLTSAAACLDVEVNCHTGDVTVLSADLVVDVGKSLNPAVDIGQVEGAFVQGLGYVTTEELVVSPETGRLLTDGPGGYKIPTVADAPRRMNVTLLTHREGRPTSACYSSKGVGEPPLLLAMGVPVAARNAVAAYRAENGFGSGWFYFDLPMTSEKVRMAASDAYTEEAAAASATKGEKKQADGATKIGIGI